MEAEARGWIQQACVRGYTVIATYHSTKVLDKQIKTKKEDLNDLSKAARWWVENFDSLRSAPVMHRVKLGDTLTSIAQKYYDNAARSKLIVQANSSMLSSPDSPVPKLIMPRIGIRLPKPVRVAYQDIPFATPRFLVPGHSLTSLHPGQILTIPTTSRSFSINLMNEWGSHSLAARKYAEASNAAIGTVCKVYSGPVIIDVPGSGQETAVASSAAKGFNTDGVKISDVNTILSVHVYSEAYVSQKHGASKKREGWLDTAALDDLALAGRPCMIGEFGIGKAGSGVGLVRSDDARKKDSAGRCWVWHGMVTAP